MSASRPFRFVQMADPRNEDPHEREARPAASPCGAPAPHGRRVRAGAGPRGPGGPGAVRREVPVVDVEGGQVVDLFAFVAGDVGEYASAEHTRIWVNRLFPRVGEAFVTNRRRPILWFEADDSPACTTCCARPAIPRATGSSAWTGGTRPARRTSSGRWPGSATTGSRCRSRSTCSWRCGSSRTARSRGALAHQGRGRRGPARRARLHRGGVRVPAGPQRDQPLPANTHRHPAPRLPAFLAPGHHHRLDADLVAAGLDRLLGLLHPERVRHQVLERVDLRVPRQERQRRAQLRVRVGVTRGCPRRGSRSAAG